MSGRVAAVVVSYNVRELLLACLRSLEDARQRGELTTIVVVDNASHDGSAEAARACFPGMTVIDAPNDGYGAGANRGIAVTSEPYVLILNPDTVVQPGSVAELSRYLDEHHHVALVGPLLRYPDNSVQPTRRRFPGRLTPLFESTVVEEWWPGNPWARAFHMRDEPSDRPEEVDWVVGAAMLVRRAAVEQAGGFDDAVRMYSEEVEWCWRLRQHGWSIAWNPAAEIIHHEGASSGQNIFARQVEFDTSRVRLARRMYGPGTATVIRLGLLAGYALQIAREGLKWLLGHKRELRRQRIGHYAGALRSGLREGERLRS
jgi:N-acetylglucosaminyl-diphospho-decaprenol L-rhamnosyltransferase